MSDDKQQEPSMEDILASIRRILSEDDAEEAAKAAPAPPPPPPPPPAPPPPPPPPPPPEPDPEPEPEPMMEAAFEPEAMFEPEPEPEPEPEDDIFDLTSDMISEELDNFTENFSYQPEPAAPRMIPMLDEEDQESILAPPTQAASTGALAELARAVARERGIGLGNGGITLEDLVRDILKHLIKDWLDANLPYMIERIVKKEIEKMVNRAEKL